MTGFLGGPTVFVEAEDGSWREHTLPSGSRIENGDEVRMEDCTPFGPVYKAIYCPEHPKTGETATPEYLAAMKEFNVAVNSDETRMTFSGGKFLTLVPVG